MVVIFDVDGTLVDTYPHVRSSYIYVLDKFIPEYKYTEEQLKSFFGPTLPDTFRTIVSDEEMVQKLVSEYVKHSKATVNDYISLFPGTIETLDRLKKEGYKLAVLSNKQSKVIKEQFAILGIFDYFEEIIGYNDVNNPKPDPEGINIIQDRLGKDCVFIGDTTYDIKAAVNAGIPGIGVLWALTTEQELKNAGAQYVIKNYKQLFEILGR